jgi:hypothetical protein
VHRAATAGAAPVVGLDHDLFARQMLGQRAAIDTTLPAARRFQRRVRPFLFRLALGQRLLDVFEGQLELIGMSGLLGAAPEQGPSELLEIARRCSFCPASLAAAARSASSRTFSAAASSGSGAASAGSGEGGMGREEPHRMRPVMY